MTYLVDFCIGYRREIADVVIQHLQGNYSDTLTRYSYLGEGANQYSRLIYSPNYTTYERELNLLNRILPRFREIIPTNYLQLIDLGVGDGIKSARIISYLNQEFDISYIGLDMSTEMLEIARNNQRLFSINKNYILCDFRNLAQLTEIAHNAEDNPQLFLFLGNTLTNETDMGSYLRALRNNLGGQRNYLLVGLELFQNNANEIVKEYRNEENYALTIRPLQKIGIERTDGNLDIDFNYEQQRIEEWFIFNRDREIRISSEIIRFQNDDRILLSVTYKLTLPQIRELVRNSGWNEEMIELDDNRSYALLLLLSNERGRLN